MTPWPGFLLLLVASGSLACQEPAAPHPAPRRILFVGNSLTYTNDLPGTVQALAAAGGVGPVEVRALAHPNAGLEDHWARGDAPAAIRGGGWAAVVLQQGPSSLPESRADLVRWAAVFGQQIRDQGAVPVLYMVWPDAGRIAFLDDVAASYRLAADSARGRVAPAGEAWRAAWRRDSTLGLYGPDRFHPSLDGTYLAALTLYGTLFDRSPVGLPGRLRTASGVEFTLAPARARLLQESALEVLRGLPPAGPD